MEGDIIMKNALVTLIAIILMPFAYFGAFMIFAFIGIIGISLFYFAFMTIMKIIT